MKQTLLAGGYPKTLIDSGIGKAKCIDQNTFQRNTGSNKTDNCIAFVQMHNPNNPPVFGNINYTLQLLENSNRTKRILKDKKHYQQ